jgi:hypothetical protein
LTHAACDALVEQERGNIDAYMARSNWDAVGGKAAIQANFGYRRSEFRRQRRLLPVFERGAH